MELVRADAHLGAQAVFAAVAEPLFTVLSLYSWSLSIPISSFMVFISRKMALHFGNFISSSINTALILALGLNWRKKAKLRIGVAEDCSQSLLN
jgi:hypothetical protein